MRLKKAELAGGLRHLSRRNQRVLDVSGHHEAEEMKKIHRSVSLPGAGFAEKDGTFVNSARWLQWKWAACHGSG
jgi:NADH dehydrogenase/NADH:ubiquinone oxidoreductase subunit G